MALKLDIIKTIITTIMTICNLGLNLISTLQNSEVTNG